MASIDRHALLSRPLQGALLLLLFHISNFLAGRLTACAYDGMSRLLASLPANATVVRMQGGGPDLERSHVMCVSSIAIGQCVVVKAGEQVSTMEANAAPQLSAQPCACTSLLSNSQMRWCIFKARSSQPRPCFTCKAITSCKRGRCPMQGYGYVCDAWVADVLHASALCLASAALRPHTTAVVSACYRTFYAVRAGTSRR